MNKKIFLALAFLTFIIPSYAFAQSTDQLTVTSYYPAPFGAYDRLQLVPRAVAPTCAKQENWGTIYYDQEDNTLYTCTDDGFGGGIWNINNSLWNRDAVNEYLFPKNILDSVGIGTS